MQPTITSKDGISSLYGWAALRPVKHHIASTRILTRFHLELRVMMCPLGRLMLTVGFTTQILTAWFMMVSMPRLTPEPRGMTSSHALGNLYSLSSWRPDDRMKVYKLFICLLRAALRSSFSDSALAKLLSNSAFCYPTIMQRREKVKG